MYRHKRSSVDEDIERQDYSDEYTEIDTETLFDNNGNSARQNEWIIAAVNEELSKMIAFTGTTTSDTESCIGSEANEDVQNNNKTPVESGIDNGMMRKAYSNENIEINGEVSTIEAVKHGQSNVSDLPEFMDCGVRIIRRSKIGVGCGITKNGCAKKMTAEKDLGMDNLKLVHANDATRDRSIKNEVIRRIKECDVRINRISETDFRKMKNCFVKIKRLDNKFVAVLEYLDQVSMRRFSVQQSGGFGRSNKIVVLSQDNGGEEMCDIQENTTFNFNPNSCDAWLHKTSSSPQGISADIEDNIECQEVREMVIGQNDLEDCDKSTDEESAFNCDVSTPVDRETDENHQNCSFSTGTFYSARSNVSSSLTNDTYDSAMDETAIQSHFVSSDEEDIEKQIELIPKIRIKRKLIQGIIEFTSESISTRKRKAYDLMEFEKDAIIENDELVESKHVPVGNSDSMSSTIKVDSSSVEDQVSTLDDTPSDKMIPHILTKRKSKQWRPYSKEEDGKILKYMRENEMSGRQRGRRSWQVMEEENVCPGRSWQSMKERWIKHIEHKLKNVANDNGTN